MLINWNSIIHLNFDCFTHIKQLYPILSRFCDLRDTILLRMNVFPNWILSINIFQLSSFYYLKLRPYPYSWRAHIFFNTHICHLDIADLDRPLLFRLLFFAFFLIFGCFLCFFSLISFPSLHFLFSFFSHESLNDNHFFLFLLFFRFWFSIHLPFLFFFFWFVKILVSRVRLITLHIRIFILLPVLFNNLKLMETFPLDALL